MTGSSTLDLRSARLSRLSLAEALAASNPALAWKDAARPFQAPPILAASPRTGRRSISTPLSTTAAAATAR